MPYGPLVGLRRIVFAHERSGDYQPNNLEALLVLAAAQEEMGQHRRAQATARLIDERFPAVDVQGWLDRNPVPGPGSGRPMERGPGRGWGDAGGVTR